MRRTELRRPPQGLKAGSLKRKTAMARGSAASGSALKKGRGFAASPAQQKKAHTEPCIVTGLDPFEGAIIDPAHIYPSGCDDPLCVVPLVRHVHRSFDDGDFDLLKYVAKWRVPEMQHALGHYDGNLIGLLQRLTGRRWEAK